MAKKLLTNRWKEQHSHLEKQSLPNVQSEATEKKKEICRLNSWSNSTFYRKMDTPQKLSITEKITIAQVYNMPAHFLFPEMEIVH